MHEASGKDRSAGGTRTQDHQASGDSPEQVRTAGQGDELRTGGVKMDEEKKCKTCKHWKPRRPFVRSCRNTMSEYYGDEPEEYDGCEAWEGEEE